MLHCTFSVRHQMLLLVSLIDTKFPGFRGKLVSMYNGHWKIHAGYQLAAISHSRQGKLMRGILVWSSLILW